MIKIPISVCIIAKNEEKYIEGCLKKLKKYGFEIIVTDTGSTDNTRRIALEYADKVLDYKWIDDFADARNFCADNASNNWILVLDCDEYISKINVEHLLQCIRQNKKIIGVLKLLNLHIKSDGTTGYGKDILPRLYNKRFCKYDKRIHEHIVPKKNETYFQCETVLVPIEIIHYGYALPPEQMRIKQERNLRILYQQLEKEGGNPYIYFQLGQSELIIGNYQNAILCYEKGLAFKVSGTLLYVQEMIESLAKAYIMAGRRQDALQLMYKYENECKSSKYIFYHANVLMDNNEHLKALIKYVSATMMEDSHMLGEELIYCYQHIIELYNEFGESALVQPFIEKYNQLTQDKSNFIQEISDI